MKSVFLAFCLVFGLLLDASASAVYTFTPTGDYSSGFPSAPYASNMSLTGSFTTQAALAANLNNQDITSQVTAFSFNDGVHIWTNTNTATANPFQSIKVTTDLSGNIQSYNIYLVDASSAQNNFYIYNNGDTGIQIQYGTGGVTTMNNPGSFALTSVTNNAAAATPVPTLSELMLVLLGLLLPVAMWVARTPLQTRRDPV